MCVCVCVVCVCVSLNTYLLDCVYVPCMVTKCIAKCLLDHRLCIAKCLLDHRLLKKKNCIFFCLGTSL